MERSLVTSSFIPLGPDEVSLMSLGTKESLGTEESVV